MRRLACGLEMSSARQVAVNLFFSNERFEVRDRCACGVKQLAGPRVAEPADEGRRIELQPCEDLAAVARAGAPSNVLAFEHDDRGAGAGQSARRRQTGVAGADDKNIASRSGCWGLRAGD